MFFISAWEGEGVGCLKTECEEAGPFWFLVLQDRIFLCSSGCPETLSVEQAGSQKACLCLPGAGIKGKGHHILYIPEYRCLCLQKAKN